MANQYFSIGSPFADFVSWIVFGISFILVFYPFFHIGYIKWKKKLPVSWWRVGGAYLASLIIYLVWQFGVIFGLVEILERIYTNSWWLTTALLDGSGQMLFGVLIGWPLLASYIIMAIKLGKYIILNLLLSILVSSLLLWGAYYVFGYLIGFGFSLIHQSL
ncbi:MAG: hypothetical protein A3I86_00855 [Candidatus Zambryskibacteria bacterium RIFCSPLOWO2_02_FULL_39_14]|uniref:Uncharacterized protein n=1 Tax=Candidatus Zambryskibacteria bacterium RIFCSPLOWO2_02_FULL_39_14 TaxID=1802769 RepID=A0A1G2UFV1_9BACT|nr:MAG: hypothetical protein A3I86_00855 [Candidatus Zambryskibacteria bacterium RIFCSPLOWO2_02_FULL_39_14]